MTDPITDMLNQIRNGLAVSKPEVTVPFSELKNSIAEILSAEGFISGTKKAVKKDAKVLKVALKYDNGAPVIAGLRRVSKPGQRIYSKAHSLKSVKGGSGIAIVSTPKGLMTNKKARKENLGGEVICEIW